MKSIEDVKVSVQSADLAITEWMARYGLALLRLSLGVVFLWFGVLKFFPQYCHCCAIGISKSSIARLKPAPQGLSQSTMWPAGSCALRLLFREAAENGLIGFERTPFLALYWGA
jgi:hypothetical protein